MELHPAIVANDPHSVLMSVFHAPGWSADLVTKDFPAQMRGHQPHCFHARFCVLQLSSQRSRKGCRIQIATIPASVAKVVGLKMHQSVNLKLGNATLAL